VTANRLKHLFGRLLVLIVECHHLCHAIRPARVAPPHGPTSRLGSWNASAPCALFTLGVTVALRPFTRVPWEVPFLVLINPRIVEQSKDIAEFYEGCLSLVGFSALVGRSRGVTVEYTDEHAQPKRIEARGWFARILQHEIDHLQGRLYIDQMETRSLTTLDNLNRYWKDLPIQTVRRQLGLDAR
jgi:hypothetical protein